MNVSKKSSVANNGWILCSSKSFPGKYYYFNVLSGDAVWSLNDNENSILKKDNRSIQKLNNNSHGYPEPSTPPDMTPSWLNTSKPWPNASTANPWPNTSNSNSWLNTSIPTNWANATTSNNFSNATTPNNWPNAVTPNNWPDAANNWSKDTTFQNRTYPQHGPMFGQPAKFMTTLEQYMPMPNIVWTPIVSTSPWPYLTPDVKPTVNQLTQTSQVDRELFIQNTNMPLCQRFVNYQATSLQFNKENKIMNKNSNFVSSTPKRSDTIKEFSNQSYSEPSLNLEVESHIQTSRTVAEKATLTSPCKVENPKSDSFKTHLERRQRKRTKSESHIESASATLENATLTSPQKAEISKTKRTLKFKRKYSLAYEDKVQSSKSDDEKDNIDLDKFDLRFLLLAKRKKFEGTTDIEDKKPKMLQPVTPKKKVSFLLENKADITSSSSEATGKNSPELISRTLPIDDTYQNMPDYNMNAFNNPTTPTKTQHNLASTSSMPIHNSTNTTNYNIPEENAIKLSSINLKNTPSIGNRLLCQIPLKDMPNSMPIFNVGNKTPTKIANNLPTFSVQQNMSLNDAANSLPVYQPIHDFGSKTPSIPNNMPMYNVTNNIFNEGNSIPTKRVTNTMHKMPYELTNSMTTYNIARNDAGNSMPAHNVPRNETTNNIPIHNLPACQDIWYIVVDMDVLLEEHVFIDQLLQSDEKCRLLIPRAIRSEIESLCIGDCRGQQRVLVARRISRRMGLAHNQYVVEQTLDDEDGPLNTTDGILNCCLKTARDDNRVVLVTNDAYLKSRVKSLNIPCYNMQEIKNGALTTPKLFSELKKLKVIINNEETDENYYFVPNKISDLFTNKESIKDTDKQTNKNCDILINITKPKTISERDKGIHVEISNSVKNLNLKDARTNSVDTEIEQNSFSPKLQSAGKKNPNLGPKSFNCEKNITLSKSHDHRSNFFQNNPQNIEKLYDKMIDVNQNDSTDMENTVGNVVKEKMEIDTRTTAARQRILKIMSVLKSKSENTQKPDEKFKMPKILPFKKGTEIPSSSKESSDTTANKHSNFENSELSIEDGLKKFIVKNKTVHEKIKTRIDEWICTYTQIMEEILGAILQKNSDHMSKMKISTTNLHESLTCVKMLYDNNKLRAIIETLVDVLVKCSCAKGKLKLDTKPKDFMKIIGCSVLLVQNLKTILPTSLVLSDCESFLDSLLNNIETLSIDIDPEILRPAAVCRSEVSDIKREMRNNFQKDPTYVLNYLKKHYKEWSSCNEKKNQGTNKIEDIKVVRMIGKNASMLKIDNNKSISFTKDKANEKKDTKLVKLIEKPSNIQEKIEKPLARTILNTQNTFTKCKDNIDLQKSTFAEPKMKDTTENTEDAKKYPNFDQKAENAGPKIIRNIQPIDKYEERMKEPLDLDVLDYSDFHLENSDEFESEKNTKKPNSFHLDSDISGKSLVISSDNITQHGSSENDSSNNENYALCKKRKILRKNIKKPQSQLEDITSESNYTDSVNIKDIFGSRKIYANKVTKESNETQASLNYATNNVNNACISETYTNNDTYEMIKVTATINEDYATNNETCVINNTSNMANETLPITNELYAINNEIYATKNEGERSTPRDDTTNDSGFENESVQAHTLVHVFLNELSTSFKSIYEFINSFVKEIHQKLLVEERKKYLHIQASKCLEHMVAVMKQLTSIIKRESHDETELKRLLLQAGTEATTDKRVTRYRQIVRKCLEQAQILESALRIIICITISDLKSIVINDSVISNVKYINIFE